MDLVQLCRRSSAGMIISLDALQEYDRRPAETVEVMVRFVKQDAVVANLPMR